MANASIARGLIPVRHRNGAPYNGASNPYYVPASYGTALYVGDPVITVTASSDSQGIQAVNLATAAGGNYISGVIVGMGWEGDPAIAVTRDMPPYHLASTAGYVLVADDPDLLFEIQSNAAITSPVGRNADLASATGSIYTGYSGWQLSGSSLATTSTLQLRVIKPVIRQDNDSTLTNSKWLVAINLHASRNATGI